MPRKLLAVVVIVSLQILLDVRAVASGHYLTIDGLVVGGVLLAGLQHGGDGARRLALGMAWARVGLVLVGALAFLITAPYLSQRVVGNLIIVVALRLALAAFVVKTLRLPEVRDWMRARTIRRGAAA